MGICWKCGQTSQDLNENPCPYCGVLLNPEGNTGEEATMPLRVEKAPAKTLLGMGAGEPMLHDAQGKETLSDGESLAEGETIPPVEPFQRLTSTVSPPLSISNEKVPPTTIVGKSPACSLPLNGPDLPVSVVKAPATLNRPLVVLWVVALAAALVAIVLYSTR
ncbi:MAG: hypothetical protein V1754_00360 [Pseudomonadota bacterium]